MSLLPLLRLSSDCLAKGYADPSHRPVVPLLYLRSLGLTSALLRRATLDATRIRLIGHYRSTGRPNDSIRPLVTMETWIMWIETRNRKLGPRMTLKLIVKTYQKRSLNPSTCPPARELYLFQRRSCLIHQQLQGLQTDDDRLTRWLDPTVRVLQAFSETLGEGVSLAFSPAKAIFAGVGVLLSAAMDVCASQDTLVDIFERMESFFQRLEIYTRVSPPPEMIDIIVRIMVEVISILGMATKEMKQGRMSRMVTAQVLEATHAVDDRVGRVGDGVLDVSNMVAGVDDRVARVDEKVAGIDDMVARVDERVAGVDDYVKAIDDQVAVVIDEGKETRVAIQRVADDMDQVKRNQLRQDLRNWLSPSDPSINHNIACVPIASKEPSGFSKEVSSPNGNPMVRFCGSTENPPPAAGSGKSVLWFVVIKYCQP
ncbi:hypothetical protein BGY98DRAFT_1181612 [Russula aff. rugulosa BPL654]|nr:hypothetical protein BGY98DRAFT_1181612 [Russula aff. rugulosa BPL654]